MCPSLLLLQVLREIYKVAFQRGSSIPVPDLINSLLTVPCPQQGSPKVRRLEAATCRSCTSTPAQPLAIRKLANLDWAFSFMRDGSNRAQLQQLVHLVCCVAAVMLAAVWQPSHGVPPSARWSTARGGVPAAPPGGDAA
jgi:hypothetical protein